MGKYKQYEEENENINRYLVLIKKEYDDFLQIKNDVRSNPEEYTEKIEELRKNIGEALVLARKLCGRKGDQGGFNNQEIAKYVKRLCYGLRTLISHYYHPWELAEHNKERKITKRENLIKNMGSDAKQNMEYLYEIIDNIPEMKRQCTGLCDRAKNDTDDKWLFEAQTMRGELDFIIKRCKLIYKSYKDNEDVTKMVHRQIVYECRVMDARLRRWTDPLTDFM